MFDTLNIDKLLNDPEIIIEIIEYLVKIYFWVIIHCIENWSFFYLQGVLVFLISMSTCYLLLGLIVDFGLQLKGQLYYLNNIYAIITILIILSAIIIAPSYHMPIFTVSLLSDELTIDLTSLILYSSLISVILSKQYILYSKISSFEYYGLILLSIIGAIILLHANNFLVAYMGIELQSFCFYILVSSYRKSKFSTEAGLKYYILGSIASGIFLFGVAIIYCYLGTISFSHMEALFTTMSMEDNLVNSQLYIGFLFIIVGILFKLTIAPFHMWAVDTYEGAPTSITLFMSVVPKIAGFGFLIRLYLETMSELQDIWQIIFQVCSILTMIIGTFGALYQQRIKRFLIYSSISQVGYMLAAISTGTVLGFDAFFFFLKIYIVTLLGIFGIILTYQRSVRLKDGRLVPVNLKYISDLKYLRNENKLISLVFAIFLFSLAGIPPLTGFFSKFYVIFILFNNKFYLVAWVFVITSIISSFYYFRLIKHLYFAPSNYHNFKPIIRISAVIILVLFFILLILGIIPLWDMTYNLRLTDLA